jgi:hypothetical protein
MTATRKRPEVKEPGNRQRTMKDPTDHIREVPIGATETIRTVRNETLQSLVTTFTNMEFKSRVKRFTRTAEAIANYVGKDYSKEMKLLVKNHQKENEPKEPVMPGKEEAKSPFMMKKYKKIL